MNAMEMYQANSLYGNQSLISRPYPRKPQNYQNPLQDYSLKLLLGSLPIVTCIFNHARSCYDLVGDNITEVTGFSAKQLLNESKPFSVNMVDESSMPYVKDFLLPWTFEYIEKYADSDELDKIQISYNYKLKRKDNEVIWILQILQVIKTDPLGNPLLSVINMIDISAFKKDDKIDFSITKLNPNGCYDPVITKNDIASLNRPSISQRELQILNLLAQGKSSKQVAHMLNISIHTVNTHRKNMLIKTGCKNSMELINYSLHQGICLT